MEASGYPQEEDDGLWNSDNPQAQEPQQDEAVLSPHDDPPARYTNGSLQQQLPMMTTRWAYQLWIGPRPTIQNGSHFQHRLFQ